MVSFDRDKLKWTEFWDSFETVVHHNKRLSNVEKFTYLKSKVLGEAKYVIAGLSLTRGISRNFFHKIESTIVRAYGRYGENRPNL
ncbi:hypothetical protein DPMN_099854 [Dreissena polymorpha]|uniref:Uncharacterized protein n=1 Tax=Dreissena polymorpha TaxID=45954 RepID=A0A9D4R7M3_DREPO|nr:hypothetical protein DPMN_099854 [Dreissena polymorpha]